MASSTIWKLRLGTYVGLNSAYYVSVRKASTGRCPQKYMIIKVSPGMVGFYGIGFVYLVFFSLKSVN